LESASVKIQQIIDISEGGGGEREREREREVA